MTLPRSLAAHAIGRIASGLLILVLVTQPTSVNAQTVSGLAIGQALTVSDQNPLTAAANVALGPAQPPTAQQVLLDVCSSHGYGEDCARTLLGMMWKESQNVATAVGDHGLALGYFQIHYKLHHVTKACATDLHCSANWTLTYMEQNGYPKRVTHAVQCHNSCGLNNGYAAAAVRDGKELWAAPMTIQVALAK
jgi:hypothetical protein